MKIAVAGCGYVGLSLSTLLSQKYEVVAYDIDESKIDKINRRESPINDEYIVNYLKEKPLNLRGTTDYKDAFKDADYVIICTPTDFNEEKDCYDTSSVEDCVRKSMEVCNSNIVIKSTVPVGFTDSLIEKYNKKNIMFSPEFLREGKALYDNLYPSRIVVGDKGSSGKIFADLLKSCAEKEDVPILLIDNKEAEAVKLFANNYLALRVGFFNELDSFAENNGLNSKDIIDAVCLDIRIGNLYNNPSFGFGGYCLPKDTKQLLASVKLPPKALIENTVISNELRKDHVTKRILSYKPNLIGIYRITMKKETDNYRESAVLDIMDRLKENGKEIIIYEPTYKEKIFRGYPVIEDFDEFVSKSDIIVANRMDNALKDVKKLVYTRDIYNNY